MVKNRHGSDRDFLPRAPFFRFTLLNRWLLVARRSWFVPGCWLLVASFLNSDSRFPPNASRFSSSCGSTIHCRRTESNSSNFTGQWNNHGFLPLARQNFSGMRGDRRKKQGFGVRGEYSAIRWALQEDLPVPLPRHVEPVNTRGPIASGHLSDPQCVRLGFFVPAPHTVPLAAARPCCDNSP